MLDFDLDFCEGFISFDYGKIWYQRIGNNSAPPLIVVHGGPGLPHDYLISLKKIAKDRPVVFYDQLGCGKSDSPPDCSLWRIDRFVKELSSIISSLNISQYHLFGHSWGATLALEHALQKPSGLISLIFASPVFCVKDWIHDINSYRKNLPSDIKKHLDIGEKTKNYESIEFLQATEFLYQKHVLRMQPQPVAYKIASLGFGQKVYQTMWGPTEFICTGNLKDYDQVKQLSSVKVPVLLTCGQWDGAKPKTIKKYAKQFCNAQIKIFNNSAHMAHLEEESLYLETVISFLNDPYKNKIQNTKFLDFLLSWLSLQTQKNVKL